MAHRCAEVQCYLTYKCTLDPMAHDRTESSVFSDIQVHPESQEGCVVRAADVPRLRQRVQRRLSMGRGE